MPLLSSGTLIPSGADKSITKKIIEALKIFDCTVLNHIILTKESYFSFADDGLMILEEPFEAFWGR